ncbi:uncharacterized protein LTR77_005908 [Saxophila tyrrhenica]|uniref:Uncharacterized protein n=1 Tax=Saxophila tyrrhenica TaxID=1690608 RepID=A0AAV9P6C9_9PEZI|nr:hypothetical protein LTR77_005908 [Saxophila tyrrhenica]
MRATLPPLINALCILASLPTASTAPVKPRDGLQVRLSVADGLIANPVDGRVVLMFAPPGVNPLDNWDVVDTPDALYGKNVYHMRTQKPVTLAGGSARNTDRGVWGFPNTTLDQVPAGLYSVQAFVNIYQTVTRSDGSVVKVDFPCGDGAPSVDGYGSLKTPVTNVSISSGPQILDLMFSAIEPYPQLNGTEIGGCNQGNYADTQYLKHVKIRSTALSEFWGLDMFVGANVLLPHGYVNGTTRYPVIYHQNHWDEGNGAYYYGTDLDFTRQWQTGVIPGANNRSSGRPTPKFIIVQFRHEAPFYDDSYAVNNANLGPYGDAINEELIPYIDQTFRTIRQPYARVQDGGSTGGWVSAASLIFRPDLMGVCFSSYPDSLDFNSSLPGTALKDFWQPSSKRTIGNSPSELHREVGFSGRRLDKTVLCGKRLLIVCLSARRDVWNAVFGVQGFNNYPLEPWDKVTGVIYPGAVEYWRHMDLSHYITDNWDNDLNLGAVLRNRIFIYVGTADNYYLNLGVEQFEANVNGRGGPGWANVTILPNEEHGGNYQLRDTWNYLQLVSDWVRDHAPNGATPLTAAQTAPSARGNRWEDVLAYGGHSAAVARQADPEVSSGDSCKPGSTISASPGRWDPGMSLSAMWMINSRQRGREFAVYEDESVSFEVPSKANTVELVVTGKKRGYTTETRHSNKVEVKA